MGLDAAAWAELERQDREAKAFRMEELTRIVRTSPVPDAVLPELAWMMSDQFDWLMREHPGRRPEDRYASLQAMLAVFRTALADLMSALDGFDKFSQEANAFTRSRRSELDAIERSIQKELFAVSEAAHALVDHCRRFASAIPLPDLHAQREATFDAEEHVFVTELRRNLHHLHFKEASWRMRWGIQPDAVRSTHFELSVEALLAGADMDFNSQAKAYLRRCGAAVDVRSTFARYGRRVEAFYGWLTEAHEANLPPEVRDYRRCVRAHRVTHTRATWRLLLDQVFQPERYDPYDYLDRYLTRPELTEVLSLPMRSRDQVDRVIALVDEGGACDDGIRGLAYRLFRLDSAA